MIYSLCKLNADIIWKGRFIPDSKKVLMNNVRAKQYRPVIYIIGIPTHGNVIILISLYGHSLFE